LNAAVDVNGIFAKMVGFSRVMQVITRWGSEVGGAVEGGVWMVDRRNCVWVLS
jgi:hypothetical protein